MLHGIPFRRAARIVTDRDLQAERIRYFLLQQFFIKTGAIAIAAARVRQDQKFTTLLIMRPALNQPPLPDGIDRKLGRVGRYAHVEEAVVAAYIVNSIRRRLAQRILWKIMGIHFAGGFGPTSPRILEIPNPLFAFGIHADHGQVPPEEALPSLLNIVELTVPIRMGRSRKSLAICFEAQSIFFSNRITDTWETS